MIKESRKNKKVNKTKEKKMYRKKQLKTDKNIRRKYIKKNWKKSHT